MNKRTLPGVAEGPVPPRVVFHSRDVIARARRRAAFRDVFDLVMLGALDALFVLWPGAHVPSLDRHGSLMLLAAVNAAVVATVWLARAVPRWRARRVAATWAPAERRRVLSSRIR